jgi:hypothetical protein
MTKRFVTAFLVASFALFLVPGSAMAFRSWLTTWNGLYGPGGSLGLNSSSGNAASCALCHDDRGGPNVGFNAYGSALNANVGQGASGAIRSVEGARSTNAAGVTTNLDEITASAQPGWTTGSNQVFDFSGRVSGSITAPTGMGALDPAAAANQPPVLGAIGNRTVNEGQALTVTISATDPDGGALSFAGANLPTGANLVNNGNGSATLSWTPGFSQAGSFPMTVTVTDAGTPPQSDSETFTITVGNVNRPPVLATIGNQTASEGQALTITITATDPDGDALSFAGANLPTGANLVNNGNGSATLSWTPGFNQAGNFPMSVTVTDAGSPAQNDSETFTVAVGNVNRAPVLGAIGNRTVNEGQALAITITATDPDGDALSFAGANLPTGASLVNNPNGSATLSWTPGFSQAGNFSMSVTVTDAGSPAQNDAETFTITVGNVNRPPVLGAIGNRTVNQGQALTIAITASDADGDAVSFAGANLPTGASLIDNRNGSATLSWTPGQAGNFSMSVTVTDAGTPAQNDSETFTITVGANANRPPVLGAIGNRSVSEGQALTINVTAQDPDGGALSFAATDLPAGASLADNHDGTATLSWTPSFSEAGNFPVTVTVTDAGTPALSAAETFTITVGNVNRPPVIDPIGNRTVTTGQTLAITVTAHDADGDAVSLAATNLPAGANLVDNNNGTAAFSWTPTQAGSYPVTVTATDAGESASQVFTITVQAPAPPPPPPGPGPVVTELRIKEAEWEAGDRRLKVEGRVRPGGVVVTIIDADSKKTLGTVRADRGGEFEAKLKLASAPCRVQAQVGSVSSSVKTVEDARSCRRR